MTRRATPAPVRFWAKVSGGDVSECWNWTAGVTKTGGYGCFRVSTTQRQNAHRFAYESMIGPVPDGLVLDHLCRNPRCVNPWHLDPVTDAVNVLRGFGPAARNARKTHCDNGHAFTEDNTYRIGSGWRRCVTCMRDTQARYYRRQRAARAAA